MCGRRISPKSSITTELITTLSDDCAIQAPNPPLHQWVTCKYTRSHSHGSNHLYPLKGGWPWPNKCYRASGWTSGSSHPVSAWVRGCFLFGPCTPSPIPQNHSCVTMMGSLHVGATFPMNTWHSVPTAADWSSLIPPKQGHDPPPPHVCLCV